MSQNGLSQNGLSPVWTLALTYPKQSVSKGLSGVASCSCVDISCPVVQNSVMKVIVRIPQTEREECLRASEQGGVFVNTFLENISDRGEFQIVPLSLSINLESAQSAANCYKECIGLVLTARGSALRVKQSDHEPLNRKVPGESAGGFLGQLFEDYRASPVHWTGCSSGILKPMGCQTSLLLSVCCLQNCSFMARTPYCISYRGWASF